MNTDELLDEYTLVTIKLLSSHGSKVQLAVFCTPSPLSSGSRVESTSSCCELFSYTAQLMPGHGTNLGPHNIRSASVLIIAAGQPILAHMRTMGTCDGWRPLTAVSRRCTVIILLPRLRVQQLMSGQVNE